MADGNRVSSEVLHTINGSLKKLCRGATKLVLYLNKAGYWNQANYPYMDLNWTKLAH